MYKRQERLSEEAVFQLIQVMSTAVWVFECLATGYVAVTTVQMIVVRLPAPVLHALLPKTFLAMCGFNPEGNASSSDTPNRLTSTSSHAEETPPPSDSTHRGGRNTRNARRRRQMADANDLDQQNNRIQEVAQHVQNYDANSRNRGSGVPSQVRSDSGAAWVQPGAPATFTPSANTQMVAGIVRSAKQSGTVRATDPRDAEGERPRWSPVEVRDRVRQEPPPAEVQLTVEMCHQITRQLREGRHTSAVPASPPVRDARNPIVVIPRPDDTAAILQIRLHNYQTHLHEFFAVHGVSIS